MSSPIVFRPWTGIAVTVLVGVVVVVSLAGLALAGDLESLRRFGPAFVALALATAALFWWPAVIVGDEITVRNPFRTIVVPWNAVDGIETRFGLKLLLIPSGSVAAWAAPAPSRRTSAMLLRRAKETSSSRASEALMREGRERGDGEAATYIRRELPKRSAGATGTVIRRWNVPVIAVLAVAAGAAVAFSLT